MSNYLDWKTGKAVKPADFKCQHAGCTRLAMALPSLSQYCAEHAAEHNAAYRERVQEAMPNIIARDAERIDYMRLFVDAYARAMLAASKGPDANTVRPNVDIVISVNDTKRANDLAKSGLAVKEGNSAVFVVQSADAPKAGAAALAKELQRLLNEHGFIAKASARAAL